MRIKTEIDGEGLDKQWAQRYILDPLTAPEPSQEAMTRSGTSTAPSASAAHVDYRRHHPPSFFSAARSLKKLSLDEVRRPVASGSSSRAVNDDNDDSSRYPTPPSSAGSAGSPTGRAAAARGSGSGSGSGAGSGIVGGSGIGSGSGAAASGSGPGPGPRGDAAPLHPSNPFATTTSYARLDTHARHGDEISPPLSPQHHRSNSKPSASSRSSHHAPSQQHQLRTHRRHPSAPTPSGSWFDEPGPLPSHPHLHPPRPRDHHHRRNLSVASNTTGNSTSSNDNIKGNDDDTNTNTNTTTNLQRHRSLRQRYPGDMSHRPLDMLRADARAADRGPHQRHRKRISDTDTIDALDTIGGAYHHGGPYDATLTSRNLNAKYSPVAAVKASNEAALRATPRENIQDSLERHVPLQGTATIPAGARDMSGRIMDYEEGADLMREPDADGGAYKRWPGVQYHPDDYKGKGEPSFTIERDLKARKHGKHLSEADAFEMHPGVNRRAARQRSASNADQEGSASGNAYGGGGTGEGVRRSHSTGKKFSEGIKRRFGSLRHKKPAEVQ